MLWVTKEQIAKAREIDLLSYLKASEPNELIQDGPNRYVTKTHSSLVISNNKWIWNREQVAGVSALDYLVKVRNISFVDAVELLTGECAISGRLYQEIKNPKPSPSKFRFYPPKPLRYTTRALAYLQSRGISPEVIGQCMQAGILYESRYLNSASPYHNSAVCVFAGKDEHGEIRFANMRGINSDLKLDKAGSSKRFNFCIPAKKPHSRCLIVFESAIDALSHASLQQRKGWEWDGYRLSLGGSSPISLIAFLERNPQIKRVILHLDNDKAGLSAAWKIKAMFASSSQFARIHITVNPPRNGIDYNDVLLHSIQQKKESKPPCHQRETFII